jgi:putative PIN family toxin of toxin-antitoxin system
MRIVLDTSVIVAAARSRLGASRRLVDEVDRSRFDLLLSPPLFLEYEDVLSRPEQMAIHGLSIVAIAQFLDRMAAKAIPVEFYYRLRPQLRDPDDDLVLETAVNGVADAIVTHNIRHFLPESLRFGIPVLTPKDMLGKRG